MRLAQQDQIDTKALVGPFGACNRLEHEVYRRAALDQTQCGGDVTEDAALCGNGESGANVVQQYQQILRSRRTVGGRIDADHGIARVVINGQIDSVLRENPHYERPEYIGRDFPNYSPRNRGYEEAPVRISIAEMVVVLRSPAW